jgi:putative cell wall-binding protein
LTSRAARVVPLLCLALLAALAPPAAAHPVSHAGGPRLVNLRPAPGEIVSSGAVAVAALAASDREIPSYTVTVDGAPLPGPASSGGTHPTITAAAELGPGDHIARVAVTDSAGATAERAWRFTVGTIDLQRLAGPDRLATAVAISRDLYDAGGAAGAVLARADAFPDALAGVPLAATLDGPLLLTAADGLSEPVAQELARILPESATVHLLGGSQALGEDVARDVRALGFVPRRLSGESRYATAAALARFVGETATAGARPETRTALVVSGENFADALAASSPAAIEGWPILLTRPGALPEETRSLLVNRRVDRVVVIGGEAAVGAAVVDQLEAVVGDVDRVSGPSRFDTAAAVARRFLPGRRTVAIANGERFPDALAGGRHAAALGAPLLLAQDDAFPAASGAVVAATQPTSAVIYGGDGAVSDRAAVDVERARADAGGPVLTAVTPPPGQVVNTLDQVVLSFERQVSVADSSIYVTIGGQEVMGSVGIGDFPSTLVFTATEVPEGISSGLDYEVRVTAAVHDGAGWVHQQHSFLYRKVDLSRGDSGPLVVDLQNRLVAAGYWLGPVDGEYGALTHQAVMALQKVHGLPRDGVYGPATRGVLESNPPRPAARSSSGLVMEVDKPRQVLLMVRDGQVEWVFNTSTGTEQPYVFEGEQYLADTPPGRWTITRQIDGVREGALGRLYRPKYFHPDGIAIHGSSSIPAYPASHGCVRVTNAAIDWMWDRVPLGTGVWVY